MLVFFLNGFAQKSVGGARLRQKLQIKLSISLSHSILTLVQPVPVLTLWVPGTWQGSHLSAKFEVTDMTQTGKRSTTKVGIEPRSAALDVDALPQGR